MLLHLQHIPTVRFDLSLAFVQCGSSLRLENVRSRNTSKNNIEVYNVHVHPFAEPRPPP